MIARRIRSMLSLTAACARPTMAVFSSPRCETSTSTSQSWASMPTRMKEWTLESKHQKCTGGVRGPAKQVVGDTGWRLHVECSMPIRGDRSKGENMPSPFPGMDPYLEGSLWTNVHTQLSVEIARQLAPRLRPRYLPFTEKRFVVAAPEDEDGIA